MARNLKITTQSKSLFLLVFTLCAVVTSAQQAGDRDKAESLNYGFVSPNTRENLTLEEAIAKMRSPEENKLMTRIGNFSCVVQRRISSLRTLGSWSDGAEDSVLLRLNSDESTIRYLLSRVGKEARQKSVLYFHPVASGNSRLYALRTRGRTMTLKDIAAVLESAGLAFRALVPGSRYTVVFVVDPKNELRAKVVEAANRLRGKWSYEVGHAEFIGDDSSSEKAQTIFEEEIVNYEKAHPALPPSCEVRSRNHSQITNTTQCGLVRN